MRILKFEIIDLESLKLNPKSGNMLKSKNITWGFHWFNIRYFNKNNERLAAF
jgi:hypothetical protein